jgi:hypothetical protein
VQENNQQIKARKQQSSNPLHAMRRLATGLGALLALSAALAQAQSRADYCGGNPAAGFDRPPNASHVGQYVNKTYGYSVTIPTGITAFTEASGPQRGFVIELSAAADAVLRVDASYDAFYDITAAGVHRRDLNAIRLHDVVLSDEAVDAALARSPGGRYLMRVQCHGAPAVIIHEEIIALRNREIYRLDLRTTPVRYAQDVRYLNALLKSWQWETVR